MVFGPGLGEPTKCVTTSDIFYRAYEHPEGYTYEGNDHRPALKVIISWAASSQNWNSWP